MYIPSDDELDDFIGDSVRPFLDGSCVTRDDTLGMVKDLRQFILGVLEKNGMTLNAKSDVIREQVKNNYETFQAQIPSLLPAYRGKFALMRDRKIVEFFDTARDAYVAGQKLYDDRIFSIQEVVETPIDLSFSSSSPHPPPVFLVKMLNAPAERPAGKP